MSTKINQKAEAFFQKYPTIRYKKGESVIRLGDKVKRIYYLKKGLVRQFYKSPKGESLMVHVFRPGSFFLMAWLLENPVNTFFFEAVNTVLLYQAPIEDVRKFIQSEPEVLFNFTLRLLKGVDGLTKRLEIIVFDQAYIKVATLLFYIAKTFGSANHGEIVVNLPLTHKEIASWTGITRETACLQVGELKQKGIISYRGRQMIINSLVDLEKEITSQKTLNPIP